MPIATKRVRKTHFSLTKSLSIRLLQYEKLICLYLCSIDRWKSALLTLNSSSSSRGGMQCAMLIQTSYGKDSLFAGRDDELDVAVVVDGQAMVVVRDKG